MPLNDELARCWAPIASQAAELISTELAAQLKGAYVEVDLSSPPAISAIPDPTAGGTFSLLLPAQGQGWSLTAAGRINLPSPFSNRTLTITLSNLQVVVEVQLSPPVGTDPRPRITSTSDITLSVNGLLVIDIDGAGEIYRGRFTSDPAQPGVLLLFTSDIQVAGIGKIQFTLKVSRSSDGHSLDVSFSLPPLQVSKTIAIPAAIQALLGAGLPRVWPPVGTVQPMTELPTDFVPRTLSDLVSAAGVTRGEIRDTHQTAGVLSDFFKNHQTDTSYAGICGDEDSAIWTGHLLAADALNNDLVNLDKTLTGIERLFDVPYRFASLTNPPPSDPKLKAIFPRDLFDASGLFCRCALPLAASKTVYKRFDDPSASTEDLRPPEDRGTAFDLSDQAYYRSVDAKDPLTEPDRAHGRNDHPPTRDQLMGITLGLAFVLRFVTDQSLLSRAKRLATQLAARLDADGWTFLTPSGDIMQDDLMRPCTARDTLILHHSMQLAVMRVAATADWTTFGGRYAQLTDAFWDSLWIMPWIDTVDALASLYPINLHHAAYASLMLLEDDATLQSRYRQIGTFLEAAVSTQGNAYFDLMRMLAENDAERLDAAPPTSQAYFGEARWEDGILKSLSDAVARLDSGSHMAVQKNPDDTAYLTSRLAAPNFMKDASGNWQALFAVPVSRRPGGGLDFAWQRGPFVNLGNGEYPQDRKSVTSPGLDVVLPVAVLAKLKGGVGSPVPSPTPGPVPVGPQVSFGSPPYLSTNDQQNLADIVTAFQTLQGLLNGLHELPTPAETLNSRFRDYLDPSAPDSSDALKRLIASNYGTGLSISEADTGILVADALFALAFNEPNGAEFSLLSRLRETLQRIWGNGAPAFEVMLDSDTGFVRDRQILQARVRAVLPGAVANELSNELTNLPALAPIVRPGGYFTDPDAPFGMALRQILLTDIPR